MLLQREPVLITTALRAAILMATAFGLRWSPEQVAAILVFTEAVLAVLVRSKVSSPATTATTATASTPATTAAAPATQPASASASASAVQSLSAAG